MSNKEICHNNNGSESIVHVGATHNTLLSLRGKKPNSSVSHSVMHDALQVTSETLYLKEVESGQELNQMQISSSLCFTGSIRPNAEEVS